MSDVGQGGTPATQGTAFGESPLGTTQPPYGTSTGDPMGAGPAGSTTDTAKHQAGQVAQDAKESGRQVAGAAMDQGRDVLQEGRDQARDLAREARQQVHEQSRVQKDRATTGLRSLADELGAIGSGRGGQSGLATDLAQQFAGTVRDAAGWIESREPGDLVEELREVARRRPGAFLLGAAAAGLVAGRLTRGAVDAARSDDEGTAAADDEGVPSSGAWTSSTESAYPTTPDVDLTVDAGVGSDLPTAAGDRYSGSTGAGLR